MYIYILYNPLHKHIQNQKYFTAIAALANPHSAYSSTDSDP